MLLAVFQNTTDDTQKGKKKIIAYLIKNYKSFFDEHPHSINGTVNVIWLASVDGSID